MDSHEKNIMMAVLGAIMSIAAAVMDDKDQLV